MLNKLKNLHHLSIKTKLILIGVAILLMMGVAVFVSVDHTAKAKEDDKVVQAVPSGDSIHVVHERLNTWLGWSNANKYKDGNADGWKELEGASIEMAKSLDSEKSSIQNQNLLTDITNASEALKYGSTHHDVKALLTAHRILHDLDIKFLGYTGAANTFGYTNYKADVVNSTASAGRYVSK